MRDDSALADVVVDADEARATLRPDRTAVLCEGHFPGDPIVPGALLVGVMAELASHLAGTPGAAPAEVGRAVFLRSVRPGERTVVVARRAGERIVVAVRAADVDAARASFRFGAGA